MSEIPLVTVLMSVYNGEKYLREAIESILNQTFIDFEFLILNDGSTDNSLEIIRSYNDSRIYVHHSHVNRGLIFQLNKGLELSHGKYIARMDADDVSLPERLAKQVNFLATRPEIGVLGTWAEVINEYKTVTNTVQFSAKPNLLKWYLCYLNPIVHPSVMMRRDIVEQVGAYCLDMMHVEDYDLWCRLSRVTHLSNMQAGLLQLRKHDANVSLAFSSEQLQKSVKVSCSIMSLILKADIPFYIVQCIWYQKFKTASEMREASELVYKLFKAFMAQDELSIIEKLVVRRDTAKRLFGFSRSWIKDRSAWGVFARVCYLDPFLVGRIIIGWIGRIFKVRLGASVWLV